MQCIAVASVDIKAVIDTAWSSAILHALSKHHCPVFLTKLIKSFLENRQALFTFHPQLTHADVTCCPQGIALFLWAVLIDDTLRPENPFSNITVAFAAHLSGSEKGPQSTQPRKSVQGGH